MSKVAGTEFLWYAANRAFQLAGGEAYMNDQPYAKILRDIRIYPIFEGSNDVLRTFIALSGLKVLGDELEGLTDLDLLSPVRSGGLVLDDVLSKVKRRVAPPELTHVHPDLRPLAEPLSDQVGPSATTTMRCVTSPAGLPRRRERVRALPGVTRLRRGRTRVRIPQV